MSGQGITDLEIATRPVDEASVHEGFEDINAPYDPLCHEAWEITKHLLEARLGKYSIREGAYLASPPGSNHAGFQQEYPVDFYRSYTGEGLLMNLVLKGRVIGGRLPVWADTRVGVVGRQGKDAQVVFLEQVAIVREPFEKWHPDLYTHQGEFTEGSRALRAMRLLRLAKKHLYLPEWIARQTEQQDNTIIDVEWEDVDS